MEQENNTSEENTTETTESLDDIYREFNSGQTPPEQSTQQKRETRQDYIPDPVTDPDGFKSYYSQKTAALEEMLQSTVEKLDKYEQSSAMEKEEQELQGYVDKVAEKVEGPKKLVKYALADLYNSDPKFKHIYDNRKQNPVAFEKALNTITPQIAKDLSIKPDPQLSENQKALDKATRPTTEKTNPHEELLSMPGNKFDQEWERLKSVL